MTRLFLGSTLLAMAMASASCNRIESTGSPVKPSIGTLASLNGTVRDPVTRAPLSGVVVTVRSLSMTTGLDGQFSFSDFQQGDTLLTARRQGLVNFAQTVTLAGARTLDIGMVRSNTVRIGGNWSGSWQTTTLDRTGGLTMSVVVNTLAESVLVDFDVNGNLVGVYDPPGDVFPGTLTSADAVHILRVSPVYGTVTADITTDGRIVGSATRIPFGTATRVDFAGTISATSTAVTYTIVFADGTAAVGTATMFR